jgi:hypothetical protein
VKQKDGKCQDSKSQAARGHGGGHARWSNPRAVGPPGQRHPQRPADLLCRVFGATGVYESWVNSCPLNYTSPNAPSKKMCWAPGCWPYWPGTTAMPTSPRLRADAVSPQILGMNKIISEDALRRALAPERGAKPRLAWCPSSWQRASALNTPWILDIDTTIKPLYGKQEGAQVSYNPHKPGRPSHALHTYWVANLRWCSMCSSLPAKSTARARPARA